MMQVSASQGTLRPTTASTNSHVLSQMQRGHKGQSILAGSISSSSNRPMSASQRAEELRNKTAKANNLTRAMKLEAQVAAENKKR